MAVVFSLDYGALSGWGTPGSAQLGSPPRPGRTCTPKLQSCGKQLRGAEERRSRPGARGCLHREPAEPRVARRAPRQGRRRRRGRGGEGRGVGEQLPGEARRKVAPRGPAPRGSGNAPGSQWLRRGVQQMASDCAVPSSSSSSSFSAEEPESPPGCQTLEWVVSRHTPPSFLRSGSSGLGGSQRLRQQLRRGGCRQVKRLKNLKNVSKESSGCHLLGMEEHEEAMSIAVSFAAPCSSFGRQKG
ncbi:PREDICTED: uncharacterized protein LOC105815353 [Propithecus coquereli]|uniref:uncharacterized protein LOC105815353 n=1 Tax=Propithecus coquereli TaxID=379532 RepID=UPI00063FCF08|nr:PREDICTED: uncharacterized protein LOC105815353 [Propithecus coquereli]